MAQKHKNRLTGREERISLLGNPFIRPLPEGRQ